MKNYVLLIALIAAVSTMALLIKRRTVSDEISEEFNEDSMMNYLGV